MNINTTISAVIAAMIGFGTGAMAMLTQDSVHTLDDVSTLSWTVLALGSFLSFLKDFQTIATRALASSITRRPLAASKYYRPLEGDEDDEVPTLDDRADPAPGDAGGVPRNP
jgi:hypothetical protein